MTIIDEKQFSRYSTLISNKKKMGYINDKGLRLIGRQSDLNYFIMRKDALNHDLKFI